MSTLAFKLIILVHLHGAFSRCEVNPPGVYECSLYGIVFSHHWIAVRRVRAPGLVLDFPVEIGTSP